MKRFEAWESLNGGCWEQDEFSEPIEAESETEALEEYIGLIEDVLRALDAVRVEDPYPYSVTYEYGGDDDRPPYTIEFKMKEVEDDE